MMPSTAHLLPSLVNRSSVSSMCCNPLSNDSKISSAVRRGSILLLSVGSFHLSSPSVSACKGELPEAVGISHRSVTRFLRRVCDEFVNLHLPERTADRADPLTYLSVNLRGNYLQREASASTAVQMGWVSHSE